MSTTYYYTCRHSELATCSALAFFFLEPGYIGTRGNIDGACGVVLAPEVQPGPHQNYTANGILMLLPYLPPTAEANLQVPIYMQLDI